MVTIEITADDADGMASVLRALLGGGGASAPTIQPAGPGSGMAEEFAELAGRLSGGVTAD